MVPPIYQRLCSAEDYKRPGGQMFHIYLSPKFAQDQAALWEGTNHGAVQAIATDGVCCPLKVKLKGRRIDDTTGGNSGIEPRMSLIYTQTVSKWGYRLADFVALISSNAAKIMGLYRRKGALAIGSDTDIVRLDPRGGQVIRKEDLRETDYPTWEGHEVTA
jgi:dihydropyrimidinase